ncbi:MAG: hypothetical protein R3D55_03140 [Chloroflexota bacterium]
MIIQPTWHDLIGLKTRKIFWRDFIQLHTSQHHISRFATWRHLVDKNAVANFVQRFFVAEQANWSWLAKCTPCRLVALMA